MIMKRNMCVNRCCNFSGDRNVLIREAKKILKYEDLTIETQSMWNVKAKMIPLKRGATGTILKSFRQYLNIISGKHEIKKYTKNNIGHCTHTSESANVKVQDI
jgi:hypothetical protein